MIKKLYILTFFAISLFANLTIDKHEHLTLSLDENLTIDGTIKISKDSTFSTKDGSYISLSGDWVNRGRFVPSTSTVRFVGDGVSTILGENSFYSFVAYKSLSFESDVAQEMIERFVVYDADINSTIEGVWSMLNLATTQVIELDGLSVKDSKIIGRAKALNPPNSIDNGNNVLWFSSSDDEEEIDSGYEWITKKEDTTNHKVTYVVKKHNQNSAILFQDALDVKITPDKGVSSVKFEYKAVADEGQECSKNIVVILDENATIKSGFEDCTYGYLTIKNWESFENAKVVIRDLGDKDHKSVIVVDANLTSPLIIGGVDAN